MKTKAAVLTKLNSPLEIMDLEIPKLGRGHVLVKVNVAGICGSQKLEISGFKNNGKFLPHMMGHEGCGHVIDIGEGVTTVASGDKVVMHWRCGSGIESGFVKYSHISKPLDVGSGKVVTFTQYAVVSENRVTTIDDNTPSDLGALMGCSLTTGFGAVYNQTFLDGCSNALIIGCGGVGRAIAVACYCEFSSVDIIDKQQIKGLPRDIQQIEDCVKNYDVIYDTVGNNETINKYLPYLNDNKDYIVIGQGNPNIDYTLKPQHCLNKSIIFSQGGDTSPDDDIPRYIKLLQDGFYEDISYKDFISHRYPLEQVNIAIEQLGKPNTKRIMLNI
jgi:Zn-dependent alcohol dehydrogenase